MIHPNSTEAAYLVAIESYLAAHLDIPFVESGTYVDPLVTLGQVTISGVEIFRPLDVMRSSVILNLDISLACGSVNSPKEAMYAALDYNRALILAMKTLCMTGISGTHRGKVLAGAWRGVEPVGKAEIRARIFDEPPAIGGEYNEVFVFQSWRCLVEDL